MHPTCPLTTCLSLLLLVHPTAAHLHSRLRSPSSHDIDLHQIALSTSAATITYPSLLLRPAASLHAAIAPDPALCTPATPCALLVEAWYDGHLYSEQRPTPILLAAYNAKPVLSPQRNLRPRQRWLRQFLQRPPNAPRRIPAVRRQRHAPVIVDREALATARPYQYILLRNVSTSLWNIRLVNANDTHSNPMNATFRVTLEPPPAHPNATSGESLCPRGRSTHVCSAHGQCRRAACVCDEPYAGRYCQHRVRPLSSASFQVQSEHMQYFKYIVPRSGNIAVNMQFYLSSPLASFAQPILFVKLPYENGGNALREGPPLPSIYDIRFTDPSAHLSSAPPLQRIVRSNLRQGDTLYIAVYNHPRPPYAWYLHRHPDFARLLPGHHPVLVRLEAYPCFSNRRRTFPSSSDLSQVVEKCPTESIQVAWQLNWRFFIVPLLLGSFTLLTMIVCVSVWASVFRQHIFEVIHGYSPDEISGTFTRRDKLSEAEVNAMFPAFVFTKGETAALGATGDVCCSVCLCSFEEGELLRRLACGHSYHSCCLDQWLLTNATCPRCRKSARIRGEGLRSSWWSRRPYLILRSLLTRTGLAAWAERFRGRFEAGFIFGGEGMLDSSDYSRRYGHST